MEKKIKISFLVSSLANEGPVNVIYNILTEIDYDIFDISIVTFIGEKANTRYNDFIKFPIKIIKLQKTDEALSPLRLFAEFKNTIRNINPHILHAHCPRSLFLMYFLPKKWVKVYTIHIYPGLQQKVLYGNFLGEAVIRFSKFVISQIDKPIACAENVSFEFLKNDKMTVQAIPNGFGTCGCITNSIEKNNLRKKLNLSENITYFIFIGRFSQEKNPDFLLQMMQDLNRPDLGLVMLGDGVMWNELHKQQTHNVIMPGFVNNVLDYIKACDYYVSSSSVEGLANTLLEAMSFGLPLLLTAIPPHEEVLSKSADVIGFTYPVNNKSEFVNKIKILLDFEKDSIEKSVITCYNNNYTAKRMTKSYETVYQNILK
jgi:glycosyltransferase involved in cell wall biosynthesis